MTKITNWKRSSTAQCILTAGSIDNYTYKCASTVNIHYDADKTVDCG